MSVEALQDNTATTTLWMARLMPLRSSHRRFLVVETVVDLESTREKRQKA
jgi:hypothetical protein